METKGALAKLLLDRRVILTLGAGGVGKTTSSAAMACLGAMLGKKVALLSIDPAKRLADAMGIRLGSELSRIRFPTDLEVKGSLYGAMLDQKAVFDEMVTKWAKSPKAQERIFSNKIYQSVSANMGGPLEYMALAKLQAIVEDDSFDLIVVDTPPDTHALDFLDRPNALSGFMEKGVMTWLIKPFALAQKLGAGKLLRAGGRMMSGIAAVTGVKMLQLLAEFLILIEDVIQGFGEAGKKVMTLMRSQQAAFVLVAAPHDAAQRSSNTLMKELAKQGYDLSFLIVNRLLDEGLLSELASSKKHSDLDAGLARLPQSDLEVLQVKSYNIKDNLQCLQDLRRQVFPSSSMVGLVEQHGAIHTLDALNSFAQSLAAAEVME